MHKRIEFKQNQTLLFIGDSITDCGRREQPWAPLGWGYVHFATNFLMAKRPHLKLNIQNRGIGGDTTDDLIVRWDRDCTQLKPDIVSLMIGINDLWYKFGESHESQQKHIHPDHYETNMRHLLTRTRFECSTQFILMEPFMFCDEADNPMRVELPGYIEIVHRLAEEFAAVLVPVYTNYIQLQDKRPAEQWAEDTVHPYEWAHAWIAKTWLNTVLGE